MTLASLIVNISAQAVNFDKVSRDMDNVSRGAEKMATTMKTVGTAMSAAITAPILGIGAAAIKLGMDAVESENLVTVSFGNMRAAADDWSNRLSDTLGLNRYELRETAGTLFNMTTSMGIGRDAAFEMSTGVAELAADMASFRNIGFDEALLKIRSGLTGEAEPLKAIGILVDENTTKTYAYSSGIAQQGQELSQTQKVMARWQAILAQTKNDQGDLARTIESPTNQLRLMRTQLTEAATTLGIQLVPVVTQFASILRDLIPYVQGAVQWFAELSPSMQKVVIGVAAVSAGIGPMLYLLGMFVSSVSSLLPLLRTLGLVALPQVAASATTTAAAVQVATVRTTAFSTALGFLGPAAAVVGTAFASWHLGTWIGEVTGATDAVQRFAGRLMGVPTEVTEGNIAARKWAETHKNDVTPALESTATATKAASDAMRLEIQAQQNAALAAERSAESIKAADRARKEAIKTEAEYAEITQRLIVAGGSWQTVLDGMNGDVVASVAYYLDAGVAQDVLAKAYALTAEQIEAVAASMSYATDRANQLSQAMSLERWSGDDTVRQGQVNQILLIGQTAEKMDEAAMATGRLLAAAHELERGNAEVRFGLAQEVVLVGQTTAAMDQLAQQAPKITTMASAVKSAFASIGPSIVAAFQGGGDVTKSVASAFGLNISQEVFGENSAMGKQVSGAISKFFGKGGFLGSMLGNAVNAFLPGIGALLGPLASKIGSFFKNIFGGPSEQELQGRGIADKFRSEIESMMTAADKLEVFENVAKGADEEWAKFAVTIKNQFLAIGHSGDEALEWVDKLFKAEKQGGTAVQDVIAGINTIIRGGTVAAIQDTESAGVAAVTNVAEAAAASLAKLRQSLYLGRAGSADNTGGMGALEDTWTAGDDLWSFVKNNGIADITRFAENFAEGTDARNKAANEAANWINDHPGEVEAAQAAARAAGNADQDERRRMGFATGTGGRYPDFGAGTNVTLHGRERVMTEAEGRAETGAMAAMSDELAQIRQLLRGMPKMFQSAMQGASV